MYLIYMYVVHTELLAIIVKYIILLKKSAQNNNYAQAIFGGKCSTFYLYMYVPSIPIHNIPKHGSYLPQFGKGRQFKYLEVPNL